MFGSSALVFHLLLSFAHSFLVLVALVKTVFDLDGRQWDERRLVQRMVSCLGASSGGVEDTAAPCGLTHRDGQSVSWASS